MLMPFYFLFITALKPDEEAADHRLLGPAEPPDRARTSPTSSTAGGDSNILLGLLHSVIITVGSIVGLIVIGSLAAYVLARSTRRWGNVAYYLFLIAIILPTQLGLIPLYIGARSLGLVGTLWG